MSPAALAVIMFAAGQSPTPPAPASPSELPISIERVQEGLQRAALKIPPVDPTPVFRSTVTEEILDTPLQGMRRELARNSGYPGPRGIELLGKVMGIVNSIKAKFRAYSEARIRTEVQAELAAFCAEHDCSSLEDGPPPLEGIVLPRRKQE